jgi:hypothetical protein
MDGGRSKKDSSSREQPRNGGDKTQEGDMKWREGGGEEEEEDMQCDECTGGGMHQMDGWMNGGEKGGGRTSLPRLRLFAARKFAFKSCSAPKTRQKKLGGGRTADWIKLDLMLMAAHKNGKKEGNSQIEMEGMGMRGIIHPIR